MLFSGTFDGQGHTIYLNRHGLFGYIKDATVKMLYQTAKKAACKEYILPRGWMNAAVFAGSAEDSEIINCINYGSVEGSRFVGGIAGYTKGIHIFNCVNYGSVKFYNRNIKGILGGIVAINEAVFYGSDLYSYDTPPAYSNSDSGKIAGTTISLDGSCINLLVNPSGKNPFGSLGINNTYKSRATTVSSAAAAAEILDKEAEKHDGWCFWQVKTTSFASPKTPMRTALRPLKRQPVDHRRRGGTCYREEEKTVTADGAESNDEE